MTFLEWCKKDPEDDRPLDIKVIRANGKTVRHIKPGQSVPYMDFEYLRPLELLSKPKLKDDIWYVKLKG